MPGVSLGRPMPLRPDRAVGPDHDLLDRPEDTGPDQFDARAEAILRGSLVAHLGAELLLGGEGAHDPGFLDRPGQRLLAEAVLAHPHGHHAGRGMRVVGRADRHGVDLVAQLLEHLAVVEVLLRLGEVFRHLVEDVLVDVAEGDDLAVLAGVVGVAVTFAADSDAGEADLLIWREARATRVGAGTAQQERAGAGHRGLFEKLTTVHGGELRRNEVGWMLRLGMPWGGCIDDPGARVPPGHGGASRQQREPVQHDSSRLSSQPVPAIRGRKPPLLARRLTPGNDPTVSLRWL